MVHSYTGMHSLTMETLSEKCLLGYFVVVWASKCTYTSLSDIAHYALATQPVAPRLQACMSCYCECCKQQNAVTSVGDPKHIYT
jgi:hypothetical protein